MWLPNLKLYIFDYLGVLNANYSIQVIIILTLKSVFYKKVIIVWYIMFQ